MQETANRNPSRISAGAVCEQEFRRRQGYLIEDNV